MTRVVAPSRLHFGLLHVPLTGLTHWPDGLPVRQFGGVGLMVAAPAAIVRAELSDEWSAAGPHAERAIEFAQRFVRACEPSGPRFRVTVEQCPPEHVGLGVGTQLGMAVGKAVAGELDSTISTPAIGVAIGRGERSGIGVHGFGYGGLLIDGGKLAASPLAPCVTKRSWDVPWRIVLARPPQATDWHGHRERMAFARERDPKTAMWTTERLCRLTIFSLVPALAEKDYLTFGNALYEYNRTAGEAFMADQGGIYASQKVDAIVNFIRHQGIPGVGQSSWGPTVFAVCESHDHALRLADQLRGRFPDLEDVTVTTDSHGGRYIDSI